jgi:hypothetical protein
MGRRTRKKNHVDEATESVLVDHALEQPFCKFVAFYPSDDPIRSWWCTVGFAVALQATGNAVRDGMG